MSANLLKPAQSTTSTLETGRHQISSTDKNTVDEVRIYLGGSFDPVHRAHVTMLSTVYNHLQQTVLPQHHAGIINTYAYFLPTARSPFKSQTTDAKHRIAMLQQACKVLNKNAINESLEHTNDKSVTSNHSNPPNQPFCSPYNVDTHEIFQPPPSYTIDTLKSLRQQYPTSSLIFIMGADSVASLPRWKQGEQLTEFAHLWIIPRQHLQSRSDIGQQLSTNLQQQITTNIVDLKTKLSGRIYIDTTSVGSLSSSAVRYALRQRDFDGAMGMLAKPVYHYIRQHQLYT